MNKKMAIFIPIIAFILLTISKEIFDIHPKVVTLVLILIILSSPILKAFANENKNR